MKSRALWASVLLFGSGLTALVYQVAWTRELRLVFGFSTAASAAVVAIFMGGLGFGGLLLGPRADRSARPLAFYGQLELLIAASAAVTPLLVWLVRVAYIATGGTGRLGMAGGTIVRLLFSAIVLALPTVLMGGTLPAATRAIETDEDQGRRFLALLYGSNTLGAVSGTVLSNFLLLEALGTRLTLWTSCLLNALVGLAALRLSRRVGFAAVPSSEVEPPRAAQIAEEPDRAARRSAKKKEKKARRRESVGEIGKLEAAPSSPSPFVLIAAATTGFAFTLMEIVWYRMLAPLLGGSTYTFGLILAVALLGIGLGSLARSRRKQPATIAGFAATCALEAGLLAAPYGAGDSVAVLAALLRPLGAFGFGGFVLSWSVIAFLVVFPASFVAGYQFPLLIGLLGRGRENVGRDVGLAYAWNTAGAILGSLAGGFGLLPLLSAPGTWVFATALLTVLAAVALLLSWRRERAAGARWAALGAGVAAIVLMAASGPTAAWRHSPIGAGRVDLSKSSPNRLIEWLHTRRRQLFWQADGVESSVALMKTSGGLAFAVNGKIDGNSRGDAPTQVMGGMIGATLHPEPRRALVIGLGTGSTAGWLAAIPSMERVDVIELEPAIRRVAEACMPVNHDALSNSKVRVSIGDAREFLLTSRETYDIIFSEPSNPYRAGISSLFTEEFYRAVRERLAPRGIFLQWLQSYEVDGETVRTVYAALHTAFPQIESWFAKRRDLILLATREPVIYDVPSLRARLATEPFRSALALAWGVEGLEGFLSHYISRPSFVDGLLASEGSLRNTDDRNVIEFAFARSLGRDTYFDLDKSRMLARQRNEDTPILSGGNVDWDGVRRARIASITADGIVVPPSPEMRGEELRQSIVQQDYLQGRLDLVLPRWRAEPWIPVGPVEVSVVAEALAVDGDEGASIYIARLAATRPVDAATLLAHLRWRQGRFAEAADLLEKAYVRYRTDAWPSITLMNRTFILAADIAGKDKALANRLEKALSQPFAVSMFEEERQQTRFKVATYLDSSRLEDAIADLEPNVPWKRAFLERRVKLYDSTGNRRAASARQDLARFLRHDATGQAFSLESSGEAASAIEP
ncbi:MAG TPA: fused MFS/spermidine synthase [Thermoanaerobaculia bacterium]